MVEEIHLGRSYGEVAEADWIDFQCEFATSRSPVFIRINTPGSKYHDSIMEITPCIGSHRACRRDRSNLDTKYFKKSETFWQALYQTKRVYAYVETIGMEFPLSNKDFVWLKGYSGPTKLVLNDTKKPTELFDKLGQQIVVGGLCVVGSGEPSFAVVTKIEGQYPYVKRIFGGHDHDHGVEKKLLKLTNIFMITDDLKKTLMMKKLESA